MSKYYTPEIEEFHIGFEFEIFDHDDDEWSKHTYIKDDKVFGLDDCHDYYEDLRIKYLDQEDIESLGFKIHDYDNMDSFTNGDIDIEVNGYTNELVVEIWTRYNMLDGGAEMVFKGEVKNKSELKKILKQIGYE